MCPPAPTFGKPEERPQRRVVPQGDAGATTGSAFPTQVSLDVGKRDLGDGVRSRAEPAQDLFVGSGVTEAGWRRVIGRPNRSGRFWTVDGANVIIALRCAQLSNRFDDYWEDWAAG